MRKRFDPNIRILIEMEKDFVQLKIYEIDRKLNWS